MGESVLRASGLLTSFVVLAFCSLAVADPWHDPCPAEMVDSSGLFTLRYGSIQFVARDGNVLTAYTYRGTRFDPRHGNIWFIQHGASRTAESYLRAAAPVAERHDLLALAILFPEELYPGWRYTLGVGSGNTPRGPDYDPEEWRAPEDYIYSELNHVFESVRTLLASESGGYYMFGHSAGGQFAHRLLTFLPDAPVLRAVAANSGWYTLPHPGSGQDPNYFMPYGLQGTPLSVDDNIRLLQKPLIVLAGENDILTPAEDETLSDAPQALYQGINRLERAIFYYQEGAVAAEDLDACLGWQFDVVPGAAHDKDEMMPSAGLFLFKEDHRGCEPTPAGQAGGLILNEIHADPDSGAEGDANRDGVRDAADDEFIELINNGDQPLCLQGWTVTDVDHPQRHRFPVGTVLYPGGSLVIFGGGEPTGDFGQAHVQWVVFGSSLSLSNSGDVLTLRDHEDQVFQQISWGDCAGAACAPEHLPYSLSINQSITHYPDLTGPWHHHLDVSSVRYSPGVSVAGQAFVGQIPGPCPGDVDGNRVVDFADVLILLGLWGQCGQAVRWVDVDDNGLIDFADILILLARWGACPPP